MNEETIFLGALERAVTERDGYLAQACGSDPDLRRRPAAGPEGQPGPVSPQALPGWGGEGVAAAGTAAGWSSQHCPRAGVLPSGPCPAWPSQDQRHQPRPIPW